MLTKLEDIYAKMCKEADRVSYFHVYETVKERLRPMRGFKNEDSARIILEGYTANYNYARPHLSLKGKTPAQQAGIALKGWKQLVENAIQAEAKEPKAQTEPMAIAPVQVV